jgi:2-dehydro-3-deoxy-D-arabinonate dehydratase
MLICRFEHPSGVAGVGGLVDGVIRPIVGARTVGEALRMARSGALPDALGEPAKSPSLLAPVDGQEVWAAGVTYVRSKAARQAESAETGASVFYDRVYDAERPELFLKATAARVVGPGAPVRVRRDSTWSVPEPELALWLDHDLSLLGLGLGNDLTARDIEAANPLYIPQAKIWAGACSLGPGVLPTADYGSAAELVLRCTIEREGAEVWSGELRVGDLHRRLEDLVDWLGRENHFPDGVVLMTGTGIVPPDSVALQDADVVHISAGGLGTLTNPVTTEALR